MLITCGSGVCLDGRSMWNWSGQRELEDWLPHSRLLCFSVPWPLSLHMSLFLQGLCMWPGLLPTWWSQSTMVSLLHWWLVSQRWEVEAAGPFKGHTELTWHPFHLPALVKGVTGLFRLKERGNRWYLLMKTCPSLINHTLVILQVLLLFQYSMYITFSENLLSISWGFANFSWLKIRVHTHKFIYKLALFTN